MKRRRVLFRRRALPSRMDLCHAPTRMSATTHRLYNRTRTGEGRDGRDSLAFTVSAVLEEDNDIARSSDDPGYLDIRGIAWVVMRDLFGAIPVGYGPSVLI